MLFKNLTISSLFKTIPLRLFLDGIAAITFLKKKNGFFHLIAVLKAHFSFYFTIPNLITKRRKINQQDKLLGKVKFSLLLKNKIKRIKTYSELKNKLGKNLF